MEFKARQLANGNYNEWTGVVVIIEAKTVLGAKRKAAKMFGDKVSFGLFLNGDYIGYRLGESRNICNGHRIAPEWITFHSTVEESQEWMKWHDAWDFESVDAVEEKKKERDARLKERNKNRADRINKLTALIDQAQAIAKEMEADYASCDIRKSYSNEILADLNNVYGRIEKLRFA